MNRGIFQSVKGFLKKEGFYVVLFVCLCVVAIAAVTTTSIFRPISDTEQVQEENNIELGLEENVENIGKQIDNALEVKENTEETVPVVNVTDTTFTKPVDGDLVRKFNPNPEPVASLGGNTMTYIKINGVDIAAKTGTDVKAALTGKVIAVENQGPQYGQSVVIDHGNGLKTQYSNLDENVVVKVNDEVTKGQVIGKVGDTRISFKLEQYGEYLHFIVWNGDDAVDPTKYVAFKEN